MTITEVPEVVINPCGGYKFIVAELTDGNGNSKLVIRTNNLDCAYHHGILAILQQELRPHDLCARCIGGGKIEINPEAKTIHVWHFSGEFGREPDRQQTVHMLQVAFPEFQVSDK